jgi:hypothetical protein
VSPWFAPSNGGYAATSDPYKGKPPRPPKSLAAVAPKKNMVDIENVIDYLNRCAAEAYARGEERSGNWYGDAYSTAATRLVAAKMQGEFEEAD